MGLFDNLWVMKYRSLKLDDVILSTDNRAFFEEIRRKAECPNLMLTGSPGIGKTLVSKVIVEDLLDCQYIYINASDESGIDTIRTKVMAFAQTRSLDGKIKVVILDECDGITFIGQQALRNAMEEYAATTRFILTCNYPYKVIPAIHSRCQSIDMTPPFDDCFKHCIGILKKEKVKVDTENKKKLYELIKSIYPDLRKIINVLQKNTIDGKLVINQYDGNLDFAADILDKLISKKDILSIREYVIHNEINFSNDYRQLLHDLHSVVFKSAICLDKKRDMLIHIGISLLHHEQVMDKEINFFTCMLEISRLLN
jgi:replication factor C small subunit